MKGCTVLPLLAVVVGIGYVVQGSPVSERTADLNIVQLLTRLSDHKTIDGAVNEVRKAGAVIADQMKKDGQRGQVVGRKEDADILQKIAELKRKPVPNMLENHEHQLKRHKDGIKDDNSLGNREEQLLLREIHNVLGNKRQEHAHSQETLEIQEGPAGAEFVMKDGVFELTVDSGVTLKVACKTVLFDGDDLFSSVFWLATGETTSRAISFGPHLLTADTNKYTIDQVETETGSDYVLGLYNLDQTDEKLYSCQADGEVAMRLYVTDLTGQPAGQVRLVDGSNANEGRVEIFENGAWGTVCDDGWDVGDATVVCRQLGLPEGNVEATSSAHFGQGEGAILLDDVSCTGDESQLSQCTHRGLGIHDCGHHEDAGVICGDVNNDGDKVTITQAGGAGEIKTIKLLTVDSGDNIALQCNVIFHDDSLPIQIPTVLWIARGTTILYDDHMLSPDLRYTFQYTGTENIVSSVLRIQGVTSEDEGEYSCQVLEFDNSVHGTSIVISVRDGKK